MGDERAVAVQLRGAGKSYGKHRALAGVDLTFHGGEVIGFIGPNGAGKTTLIKLLTGLARATEGQVEVLGEDLTKRPVIPEGIGLVAESPSFIPYLSGTKNLKLLAGIRKVATGRDIEETLHTVGLDPGDHRPVRAYSLGMRQRLGLAQALMERPKLLLLDEPTNGLDPQGIIELRALIRRLAEDGVAVFMASHLLTEVEQVCDRVLLVRSGRVIKEVDQSQREGVGLRVAVSSHSDMEMLLKWAREADIPAQTAERGRLCLELQTDRPTPQVVRELVEAGVDIEEIARVHRSLEREFMELVGEAGR